MEVQYECYDPERGATLVTKVVIAELQYTDDTAGLTSAAAASTPGYNTVHAATQRKRLDLSGFVISKTTRNYDPEGSQHEGETEWVDVLACNDNVNFTFDVRASPREQEAKITADVFVASLRVFCGPRDFLDLDVILNSFVPGRVRKSKSELALTSEAAAAAAEPADNSFELKLHIHETVVALTYGDFDSPPLAGEANAFLSGDDAIRGVTYLKTTLRKTTVNFRKSGDAGSSQDAASVVVVGVDISEVWAGGEGAPATQTPVLEVGVAPLAFVRAGGGARFADLPARNNDSRTHSDASALHIEWEGGAAAQPGKVGIALGAICFTLDPRLFDRIYYTIGFVTGAEPPVKEASTTLSTYASSSSGSSLMASDASVISRASFQSDGRSSFGSDFGERRGSVPGPATAPPPPTKATVDVSYLRILFRVGFPRFSGEGKLIPPERCARPVPRDDSFAIELFGIQVQNETERSEPSGPLEIASHLSAQVDEITLFMIAAKHDPVALLWMGCRDATAEKTSLDVRFRNPRFRDGSTAGGGAPPGRSPFGERYTNFENVAENPVYAHDEGESENYTDFTRARAQIDCLICVPVLRGRMCHDEFQQFYSLAIDLSMFEPWAPGEAEPPLQSSTNSVSDDDSSEDEGHAPGSAPNSGGGDQAAGGGTASGMFRRTQCVSFLTVEVRADTAAVRIDEAAGHMAVGLGGIKVFSCVEHQGTLDAVVTVHVRDIDLHEKTAADEGMVPVIQRFHLDRPAFHNNPDHAPPMFALSTRVGVLNNTGLTVNTVAASLTRLRLRHRVMPAGKNWLLRLIDWLDVVDPVWPGFVPASRITKLHLHFWEPLVGYEAGPLAAEITAHHLLAMINVVPGNTDLVVLLIAEQVKMFLHHGNQRSLEPAAVNGDPLLRGFCKVVQESRLTVQVRKTTPTAKQPGLSVNVANSDAVLTFCCDSFLYFIDLVLAYQEDAGVQFPQAETANIMGGGDAASLLAAQDTAATSTATPAPPGSTAGRNTTPTTGDVPASRSDSSDSDAFFDASSSLDVMAASATSITAASLEEDRELSPHHSAQTKGPRDQESSSLRGASPALTPTPPTPTPPQPHQDAGCGTSSPHTTHPTADSAPATATAAPTAAATTPATATNTRIRPRAAPPNIGGALMDALRTPDESSGAGEADSAATASAASGLSFDFNHFASPHTSPTSSSSSSSSSAAPPHRLWSTSGTGDPLLSSMGSRRASGAPLSPSPFDPSDLLAAMADDDGGGGGAGTTPPARDHARQQRKSSVLEDDGVVGEFDPIEINDAHFPHPRVTEVKDLKPESFFPPSVFSVQLESHSIQVHMRCGQMFGQAEAGEAGAQAQAEAHGGAPGRPLPSWQTEGSNGPLIFQATGAVAVYDEFPAESEYASRLLVVAHSIDIIDRLDGSHGNKFLTAIDTEHEPRESSTEMLRFDYVTVRTPHMDSNAEEAILCVEVLPVRLNIDQDALNFLVQFMSFSLPPPAPAAAVAGGGDAGTGDAGDAAPTTPPAQKGPYFKLCVIRPLFARVDTISKHVKFDELIKGNLGELAGLFSLEKAHIVLPEVVAKGAYGVDHLLRLLAVQVVEHMKTKTQITSLVEGIPIVRPFANVARATTKVLSEPLEQFPAVFSGVYDGLGVTIRTSTVELCNVATALTLSLQTALEVAHSGLTHDVGREAESIRRNERSHFSRQPLDAHDGFLNAKDALLGGVHEAYDEMIRRPQSTLAHQPRGVGRASVLVRMVGAAPAAGLRPLIGVCEAVSLGLQGIRNEVDPGTRRDLQDKYR